MVPIPQEHNPKSEINMATKLDGERVVISGISGTFPKCSSIKEFDDLLYNKEDPIKIGHKRWCYDHPEVPNCIGEISGLHKFDSQFFKVHRRLGLCMDPVQRKLFEHTYQAIYDAGYNVEQLSGKNVGVFVGVGLSESEKSFYYNLNYVTAFTIAGFSKGMYSNRISYWLDVKGPSCTLDVVCCSSLLALEQACNAIERGDCESAIVGSGSVNIHPQTLISYGRNIQLCKDGKTKSFDENAQGCVKSEGISVIFLQKAKDALRIYAEVVCAKTGFAPYENSNRRQQLSIYRTPSQLTGFLNNFYKNTDVLPHQIEYVEAFGSATPEVDKAELEAFENVFCKDRSSPLLVGSVMSNIGYTEAVSGFASVLKVLLAYRKGKIAANLHCTNPRSDVPALCDGRMRLVTEHQPISRSYAAINNLSVNGINGHVLLRGYYKPKDLDRYKSNIPHLIAISGRQETSVDQTLNELQSRAIDPEELALLRRINERRVTGHLARGYSILQTNDKNETQSIAKRVEFFDDTNRPLWFVYSGMGSQWVGMGAQLMRIPIFAAAIERCKRVLDPRGLDIVSIITSSDKTIFDNILHSFVGIAAIQIGLTDILRELGIVPDNIIGHSVGELGCGYADGCLTAEETILAAYCRGRVSLETPFIRGSMAAVGLGYQKMKMQCPPEIEVACHNGPESCTISGPADTMKDFVAKLTAQGIFAKEVPCSNIAYHSSYIAGAGPNLLKYLSEVIKNPKPRSERWLSTSIPQERWGEPNSRLCSAWYHTNNLLSSVLFEETSRHVPDNAVVVEVAPHGLLQAILKRSFPSDCRHVPLTKRGHPDSVVFFLEAVGNLFMHGFHPKVEVLYPKVDFPVSTETPFLSHLVEWSHTEEWGIPLYASLSRKVAAVCNFVVSVHDDEHNYLKGHVVQGKTIYPYSAALVAVWDTFAMISKVAKKQISVQFYDIHLYAQPPLHDLKHLNISVDLHKGTGWFEVMNDSSKVMTGFVKKLANNEDDRLFKIPIEDTKEKILHVQDVYDLLNEKGYLYQNEFRGIKMSDSTFTEAKLAWNNNWVTFIESMLQLNILNHDHNAISRPSHIHKLTINLQTHVGTINEQRNVDQTITANLSSILNYTRCGGVLIERIKFYDLPLQQTDSMSVKSLKFIPTFQRDTCDLTTSLQVYLQIVAENVNNEKVIIVEIGNFSKNVIKNLESTFNDISGASFIYQKIDLELANQEPNTLDADVILVGNLKDEHVLQLLHQRIKPNTFVITKEEFTDNRQCLPSKTYRVISHNSSGNERIELGKWRPVDNFVSSSVLILKDQIDLEKLRNVYTRLPSNEKLVVVSPYGSVPGLKYTVKQLRKKAGCDNIRLILYTGDKNLDDLRWSSVNLDLIFNILHNDVWGGEYYVPCQGNVAAECGASVKIRKVGDLASLHWEEIPESSDRGIPITVRYVGINDNDAKRASGTIPSKRDNQIQQSFGLDFSGTTTSGERVMGVVESGAASGRVTAIPELLWPVPAHWTLEDAATVPLAYTQAFYCLAIKAKLYPGMTILVHGAAGALGQAVISIALAHECKVFATVSTIRKKNFLLKLYPSLTGCIGNSRDHSFGDLVLQATNGKGCDIIISCVTGKLKNTTLKCAAYCGITFDTIQTHVDDNFTYGMFHLSNQTSYVMVEFDEIFKHKSDMDAVQAMISRGITCGYVRPLSRITYTAQDVTRAFRLLSASRHCGRVLLRLRDYIIPAQPRLICSSDRCHLIISDNQSFGLQLANRLVARGARKLHLICSPLTALAHYKIQSWQKLGADITVSSENIRGESGIQNLIKVLSSNQVEGIYAIDCSGRVEDVNSIISTLDTVSRNYCPLLKYFAVISAEDGLGELIRESRIKDQLPVTILQLPTKNKFEDNVTNNQEASWHSALDALELALRSEQRALKVFPLKSQLSLVQQIADVTDINISNTDGTVTLKQLGVDCAKSQAICSFLHNTHNVYLTEQQIFELTKRSIQELEDKLMEPNIEAHRGVAAYLSYIDSDEVAATSEFVILPTLDKEATTEKIDLNKQYLNIIPGLNGHHSRFGITCERVKLPALVLQPRHDNPHRTIQEMAQKYAEVLMKKTNIKNNFYILGYEIGILAALEVAAILEAAGLTGTVFCVGGTPEEFKASFVKNMEGLENEDALQDAVLQQIITLTLGEIPEDLRSSIKEASSWKQKCDIFINHKSNNMTHSIQYIQTFIEAMYTLMQEIRKYKSNIPQLKSKLIFIRTQSTPESTLNVDLQRYSKQPVTVYTLRAPLEQATKDPRCAAIINRHLNADILQEYETKCLCENYVVNNAIFISDGKCE